MTANQMTPKIGETIRHGFGGFYGAKMDNKNLHQVAGSKELRYKGE